MSFLILKKLNDMQNTGQPPSTQHIDTIPPVDLPAYRDIIQQIGQQFKRRGKTMLLRVVWSLLPTLVALALIFLSVPITSSIDDKNIPGLIVVGILGLVIILLLSIAPAWFIVIAHIFKIERIIWIDSFFDKVPLTDSESWKLAKSLFWPGLRLEIRIFFRYYFLVYLVTVGSLIAYVVLAIMHKLTFDPRLFLIGLAITVGVLWLYTLYISIKLRYIWFIFIDLYGSPGFSHRQIFEQLGQLNTIYQQESFKKLVATSLGIDAAGNAAGSAIGLGTQGLSHLGKAGKEASVFVNFIAAETISVTKDFSKDVAYYIFYRIARTALYGNPQLVNTGLYKNSLPPNTNTTVPLPQTR